MLPESGPGVVGGMWPESQGFDGYAGAGSYAHMSHIPDSFDPRDGVQMSSSDGFGHDGVFLSGSDGMLSNSSDEYGRPGAEWTELVDFVNMDVGAVGTGVGGEMVVGDGGVWAANR